MCCVCMHYATRVDEGGKCGTLLAVKTKARTIRAVGRGEKRLLTMYFSDLGSDLRIRLGREKEKEKVRINRRKRKKC